MAHMSTSSRNKTYFVVPSQVIKKKKTGGGAMHTGMQQYEQISSNTGKTSWIPLRKVKKQESHST